MGWGIKIKDIRDVAEYQLCCGCGACAYISPDEVRMVDTLDYGRRPFLPGHHPRDPRTAEAMKVCPGIELTHTFDRNDPDLLRELRDTWGPIYEVWEGHASDPEICFAGASGGAATALALCCIEKLGFCGVLHTAARPDTPYLNQTIFSTTREQLLAGTGSRYAPASPCDGLQWIEEAPGPCVFIGKPCDVAAVRKAARLRPELAGKLGLAVAFFCAGTPATSGTLQMLKRMGVEDPAKVHGLRYRGHGWPGRATAAWDENGTTRTADLSYEDAWGMLTKFVQWRCRLCPDHTGEFADISVGDPWYRSPHPAEPGSSLILTRTKIGRNLLQTASESNYLLRVAKNAALLPQAQRNLLRTRGEVWARLVVLRAVGVCIPVFRGFPMAGVWLKSIRLRRKARSALGTVLRIIRKGLGVRHPVEPLCAREAV